MKPKNALFARPSHLSSRRGVLAENRCESSNRPAGYGGGTLISALVGAALAIGAGAAHAIDAKVSGQLNRALMSADDGTDSELLHVDNNVSSTRFRFTGTGDLTPGIKAGILFENEFESNASNAVTPTVKSVAPAFAERHANIYFQGGFGTVSLGQGDGAGNGSTEVDLSGTDLVDGALATSAIGGAIAFRNSTVVGPTIGATSSNQDLESRYDRLRYDTPAFGPVKFALSTGTNGGRDVTEFALSYSGSIPGGKLAGAIAMSSKDADPTNPATFDQDTTGGSISWLSDAGFNVTLSTSKKDVATSRQGKFNYLKVGYRMGEHAFSVGLSKGKDQAATDDEAKGTGVAWTYTPTKWADIYAGYIKHSLDRPGSSFDDITIIIAGTRIKF